MSITGRGPTPAITMPQQSQIEFLTGIIGAMGTIFYTPIHIAFSYFASFLQTKL
jgi:hypothetical protein